MNYKIIVVLIVIMAIGLILLSYTEFKNPSKIDEKIVPAPNNTEEKKENLTSIKPVNLTENEKFLNFVNSSSNESKEKTKNELQIFWYVLNDKVLVSHELKGRENINGTKRFVGGVSSYKGRMYPPVEEFYYHLPNCPPTCEANITTPEYNNYVEYVDTKTNYVTIVVIPWIASIMKNESSEELAATVYEKLEKPSDNKTNYKYYEYNLTNYTFTKSLYHIFYNIFYMPVLYLPGFINFSESNLSINEDTSMENLFFTKKDEKFVATGSKNMSGELHFLGTEIFNGKNTYRVEYILIGQSESDVGSFGANITVLINKDTKMLMYARYEQTKSSASKSLEKSRAYEKMKEIEEKRKNIIKDYRLLDEKQVRCEGEICEYNKRIYKYTFYNYSLSYTSLTEYLNLIIDEFNHTANTFKFIDSEEVSVQQ